MQKEIFNTLFDRSKLERATSQPWRIGSDALIDTSSQPLGDPRISRVSQLPENPSTIIGGLCSIFSGDLIGQDTNPQTANIIRLDQIVEAVGTLPGKPSFIIIEDSYFENLTGIRQEKFQEQGKKAATGIEKWLRLINPDITDLFLAFTSNAQLDKELKDLVGYFSSDVIKNPNFSKIQAAPVLLMYTGFWPQLLNQLGFIPSPDVVCIEPINHFVDDRLLPDILTKAYWDFLGWLKDNPYGVKPSANANMGVAGFQEPIAVDGTQRRSRILPFTQVPNTQNYETWATENIFNNLWQFPFPLKNNPIFISGVNWGLADQEINSWLQNLVKWEQYYYQNKQTTSKEKRTPEWSSNLKQYCSNQTFQTTLLVAQKTELIIKQILS